MTSRATAPARGSATTPERGSAAAPERGSATAPERGSAATPEPGGAAAPEPGGAAPGAGGGGLACPLPVPFPQGARMLFGIGAQKAGTSWLHETLARSPACHVSPSKELHYFDVIHGPADLANPVLRDRVAAVQRLAARLEGGPGRLDAPILQRLRGAAELLAIYGGARDGPERHRAYLDYLLAGRGARPVVCDITPAYATLDAAAFRDMAAIGEARFLFILRDPVARAWSQVRMAVGALRAPPGRRAAPAPAEDGGGPAVDPAFPHLAFSRPAFSRPAFPGDAAFAAACAARGRHLIASGELARNPRADYRRTLAALDAALPAHRVHVLFFERLFRQSTLDGICAFLGIPPLVAEADRRINPGRAAPIPPDIAAGFRAALAPQYDAVRDRFGAAVPAEWDAPPCPSEPLGVRARPAPGPARPA